MQLQMRADIDNSLCIASHLHCTLHRMRIAARLRKLVGTPRYIYSTGMMGRVQMITAPTSPVEFLFNCLQSLKKTILTSGSYIIPTSLNLTQYQQDNSLRLRSIVVETAILG